MLYNLKITFVISQVEKKGQIEKGGKETKTERGRDKNQKRGEAKRERKYDKRERGREKKRERE